MGERGSAHWASVIRIFAYAGYKRDEQGRFSRSWGRVDGPNLLPFLSLRARVDGKVDSPFWSRSFSLSLAESSGAHGGSSLLNFVGTIIIDSRVGHTSRDRRRRPRTCRQCARCARGSRGARPEPGAVVLWSTRTKGSRVSLSFFSFIGFYVQMTVGRRLSGYNRTV